MVQEYLQYLQCYEGHLNTDPFQGKIIPTRADLDVKGLPQSATGQTTLLTGINASKYLGRHLSGFPNHDLRLLLKKHSILKTLKEKGFHPTFLNVFRPKFFELPEEVQWRLSATTVATLAADIPIQTLDDLKYRQAIYQDLTNDTLILRGYDVPHLTLEEAAKILSKRVADYDFILYEYFLTDKAGHSLDIERGRHEIRKLDDFLSYLIPNLDLENTCLLLSSDHGNIEDISIKPHTRNPVLTKIWGQDTDRLSNKIHSIEDITPAILSYFQLDFSPPA